MRTKILFAFSDKKLEEQVNDFLERSDIELIDLKFSATVLYLSVLIMYRRKN